jgi:hypothetical protein
MEIYFRALLKRRVHKNIVSCFEKQVLYLADFFLCISDIDQHEYDHCKYSPFAYQV